MASNAPSRKPSNVVNTRISHKPLKLELSGLARSYLPQTQAQTQPQPQLATKDIAKEFKEKEKKLKFPSLKMSNATKQATKRAEDSETAHPSATGKSISLERYIAVNSKNEQIRQQQAKHIRKMKAENSVSKAKESHAAVPEKVATNKPTKEGKSPEKAETPQRPARTKNQSHNTKVFFDKYLKFAYDLSTPDGVRKLEAHFFPTTEPVKQTNRKPSDSGDTPETSDKKEKVEITQQHGSKCIDNA